MALDSFSRVIQTTPNGTVTLEQRFDQPLRSWEFVFLAAFSLGILTGAFLQSGKEYFGNDELITSILVSNPSFSEMWRLIRNGGELNPPLFFILEWVVARIFGPGEFALRSVSAVAVALAGWALYFTARPLTGPRVAALAVALVIGLSRDVFFFAYQARYYGLLLLFVSLGVWLAVRLSADRPVGRRDFVMLFLVHCALVYLHLYGLLYSGMLFGAMAVGEWLRGKVRWGLLGAILAAWVVFCAWIPATLQQLKSVSGGIYTPPGFLKLGVFIEEIGLQTPMSLVALLVIVLAGLVLITADPCAGREEAKACHAPMGWTMMALTALALMCVPVGTWLASHALNPPPYMRRYIFPCIAAWVLMWALMLAGVHRLPGGKRTFNVRLPGWLWTLAWIGILLFCVTFQGLRAKKNPMRPAAPIVDMDYGHKDAPIVFENSWYFIQRVFYGQSRSYALLIDREAGEADPGWYTKGMYLFFQSWYPRYHQAVIMFADDLPETFLAVDDDYTKTFEWLFEQRPGLTRQLLGTRKLEVEQHGDERVWLVHNPSAGKRK